MGVWFCHRVHRAKCTLMGEAEKENYPVDSFPAERLKTGMSKSGLLNELRKSELITV
jgi:hypothetical protein